MDDGFCVQACHHVGQSAEKALKGILISLDREPRQTHCPDDPFDQVDADAAITTARTVLAFVRSLVG